MHYLLYTWCLAIALSGTASAISVVTSHGIIVGQTERGLDNFRGIPYAEPPIGKLRFRRPQPRNQPFGTFHCPDVPAACPQIGLDLAAFTPKVLGSLKELRNPSFAPSVNQSEDCLTVNVQRPANISSHVLLPVVFWVYGGGFTSGSTQQYHGDKIIKYSIHMGQPVIFVAANYRLGSFGFLPGKQVKSEGSGNAGLRDQRLALEWVQDNIAAFGGDPKKVTIAGESAGAQSVLAHALMYHGDNTYKGQKLFRGVIQNSGSIGNLAPIDSPKAQAVYDATAEKAGCSHEMESLACLRSLSMIELQDATKAVPPLTSYRGLDTSFRARPDDSDIDLLPASTSAIVQGGSFANVSYIVGNQEDEGTFFSQFQTNLTTVEEMVDYITTAYPYASRQLIAGFVDTYSKDPAEGSPYHTGSKNLLYPVFKLLSSVQGDFSFQFPRRRQLELMAEHVPCWSYLHSGYAGDFPWYGTYHASDLYGLFSNETRETLPEASEVEFYVNFVNSLDPNGKNDTGKANWPQYKSKDRQMLQYTKSGNRVIEDSFREKSYRYFKLTEGAWLS